MARENSINSDDANTKETYLFNREIVKNNYY